MVELQRGRVCACSRLVFSNSKSQRASKSHDMFKSYGNFVEWVDFAYWWSFIAEGSVISSNLDMYPLKICSKITAVFFIKAIARKERTKSIFH